MKKSYRLVSNQINKFLDYYYTSVNLQYDIIENKIFIMNTKFLLMRHAESLHNKQKKALHAQNPQFKDSKQFKQLKYSHQLIDPKDVFIPQEIMNHFGQFINTFPEFEIIVTSPLKRCLQTAKFIKQKLQKNNKDAQIIVEPFLASRLCSAWNIGTSLEILLKQYQDEHFHFCNFPENNHWGLNFMEISQNNKNKEELPKPNQFAMEDIHDLKLILSRIKQGEKQSHWNLNQRLQIVKQRLRFYGQLSTKPLLVVSHSCHMGALCSKQFDDKGKPLKKLKFKHWELVPVNNQFQIEQNQRKQLQSRAKENNKKMQHRPRL